MRIAVAGFSDETCTFCLEPTTEERFEPATLRGEAVLEENRGIPNYINGYIRAAEAEGAELCSASWRTPPQHTLRPQRDRQPRG